MVVLLFIGFLSSDFEVEPYPVTELASDNDAPTSGGTGHGSGVGVHDQPVKEFQGKNIDQVAEQSKVYTQ